VVLALWQESGNDKDRPGADCCLRPVHGPALTYLPKNSAPGGKNVAFATCEDLMCDGGGIILYWATNCELCARPIKDRTVSYSLETANSGECLGSIVECCLLPVRFFGVFNCLFAYKPTSKRLLFFGLIHARSFPFVRCVGSSYTVHANAHMHNCLRDVNEGTEDSAVAVTAPNDVSAAATVVHFRCTRFLCVHVLVTLRTPFARFRLLLLLLLLSAPRHECCCCAPAAPVHLLLLCTCCCCSAAALLPCVMLEVYIFSDRQ